MHMILEKGRRPARIDDRMSGTVVSWLGWIVAQTCTNDAWAQWAQQAPPNMPPRGAVHLGPQCALRSQEILRRHGPDEIQKLFAPTGVHGASCISAGDGNALVFDAAQRNGG
eukprot:2755436-Pyramimonas_sp.AAC.1